MKVRRGCTQYSGGSTWGLGCRIEDVESRSWRLGFRVQDLDSGFRI